MKCLKAIFSVLIISLFCNILSFAQPHPDFEPGFFPEEILTNPGNTSLSADEVFELSLLFSECSLDSPEARQCLNQFEEIKRKAREKEFK